MTPGRAVDGIAAMAARAERLIETPVGSLPQDPDWGWGLADKIGVGLLPGDLRTEEQVGRAAFRRDPEVQDASVTITLDGNLAHVSIRLQTVRGPVDIERDLSL